MRRLGEWESQILELLLYTFALRQIQAYISPRRHAQDGPCGMLASTEPGANNGDIEIVELHYAC
jgi:hypothetical protein